VTAATRAAGFGRRTVYDWRARRCAELHDVLLGRITEAQATTGGGARPWEEIAAEIAVQDAHWRLELPPLDDVLDFDAD
jgi:hypothetical protein